MPVTVVDAKWRQILAKVAQIGTQVAKVGVLQAAGEEQDGVSMVELAAIHEFGAPAANIPERSFIRRTFADKQREAGQMAAKLAKAIVVGGMDATRALGLLGAWGAAEVKKTITAGPPIPPPLQPATVERKGSSRPLVDTGRLVGAITWEVGDPEP